MSLPVIAHTTHDGPVVLRTCESVKEQRSAYRRALVAFRSGGFSPDVVGIEMGSGEPGHVSPALPQIFTQEAMNL